MDQIQQEKEIKHAKRYLKHVKNDIRIYYLFSLLLFLMFPLLLGGILVNDPPKLELPILSQIGIVMSISFFVFFGLITLKQGLNRNNQLIRYQRSTDEQIMKRSSEVLSELKEKYSPEFKKKVFGNSIILILVIMALCILFLLGLSVFFEKLFPLSEVSGIIFGLFLYMILIVIFKLSENRKMAMFREHLLLYCIMKVRGIEGEE